MLKDFAPCLVLFSKSPSGSPLPQLHSAFEDKWCFPAAVMLPGSSYLGILQSLNDASFRLALPRSGGTWIRVEITICQDICIDYQLSILISQYEWFTLATCRCVWDGCLDAFAGYKTHKTCSCLRVTVAFKECPKKGKASSHEGQLKKHVYGCSLHGWGYPPQGTVLVCVHMLKCSNLSVHWFWVLTQSWHIQ